MNILVTGAAGFIGSHLSERLAGLGHVVRGVDCLTDTYSRALKALNLHQIQERGVTFLPLDLADDELENALAGIEVIFHLAAQPGISSITPLGAFVRNNVVATSRLLDAARPCRTLRAFVNVSTSAVYGTDATRDETAALVPASVYGVTKLAAEQLVLSYARDEGFPACSVRLFSVIGPRERPEKLYTRLIGCILEDREFPLHDGSLSHLRSYTYVGDAVDGLVAVMVNFDRCAGEVFNIGCDFATTTAEGIQTVEQLLGKPARIVIKPRRPGDQARTHANIGKARRILDYQPAVPLAAGLARQIEWYERHMLGKICLW